MSLIGRFLTGEYKVIRSGPGTYEKGRYVPGRKEEIMVWGSMQPTSARELKLQDEGNRLKQFWKFYTDEPVLVNSMKTLADSDHVIINGDSYRAMSLTQWQGTDLDYFMTILWRDPEQDSDGQGAA
jgi:hypothetical protein